jgi:hypothetical protein
VSTAPLFFLEGDKQLRHLYQFTAQRRVFFNAPRVTWPRMLFGFPDQIMSPIGAESF